MSTYTYVTDKQYGMDQALKEKLDLMVRRSTAQKFDNLIVMDGDEGTGKSTFATQIAYYYAWKTGRHFNADRMFFDVENLMDFATKHEKQVIVWDEAALGGLSDQYQSQIQRKLIQILMVARKKQHFWVFCIPKFFKLREYIILDRAIALVNTLARKETQLGYFRYFRKGQKEKLFYQFKKNKTRQYNSHTSFSGTFQNVMGRLIDVEEYEKNKDQAILNMCKEEVTNKQTKKLQNQVYYFKYKFAKLYKESDVDKSYLLKLLSTDKESLNKWSRIGEPSASKFGDVDSRTTFGEGS